MYTSSLLVLALAVFGASAQTLISSGLNGCGVGFNGVTGLNGFNGVTGLNGFNGISGVTGLNGFNAGLSGAVASTPVIESVPLRLPSIIHPTSVQESCNCIKTVVRPTLRKEVYTIPSVQRFVQTTSTPVVETVPYVTGSSSELPAVGGLESGLIGNGLVSGGVVSGLNGGVVSGLNGGLVSGLNGGLVSGGIVSGGLLSSVNTGCGVANVVSGINSGFGCGY